MEVLITTDTVGGVWSYSLDLMRALRPLGVHFHLATMGAPPSADQRREAEACDNCTLYPSNFKLEWMPDPWADVDAAGEWLMELADSICPDLIHLNGYAHGRLPFRAPVLMVAHSCVLSWWAAVIGEPAPPDWNEYRHRVGAGLRAANLVVAPSWAMLEQVGELYGPLRQIMMIHNGVRACRPSAASKEPLILSAGRFWDEAKNLQAVRQAAASVTWPVYVAGDSGDNEADTKIHLLGKLPREQMAQWQARAAIYCAPARYEPFGLSILEAACAGCALVLGDIPSLREIWGEAALYVSPGDSAALAHTMQQLIDHPPLRAALARHAVVRARRYSLDRFARHYFDAYTSLSEFGALGRLELERMA